MFKDILNSYDLSKRKDFLTLITSLSLDGSFLLHHLLSCGIRHKQQIFFFSIAQTWIHYKSIQIKLGNGNILTEMLENLKFVNYDLMCLVKDFLINDSNELSSSNINEAFDDLYLNHLLKNEDKDENILIIIDDLSLFNLLGYKENFIIEFIYKIKKFESKINLIIYSQQLVSNRYLLNELKYLSDSQIQIENLKTGYSKDIQGQVKLIIF